MVELREIQNTSPLSGFPLLKMILTPVPRGKRPRMRTFNLKTRWNLGRLWRIRSLRVPAQKFLTQFHTSQLSETRRHESINQIIEENIAEERTPHYRTKLRHAIRRRKLTFNWKLKLSSIHVARRIRIANLRRSWGRLGHKIGRAHV